MALRLSVGLRNFLNEGGSLKRALSGGKLLLYTGTQPAAADDAVSGTLLNTYTVSSGAHTPEVLPTGGFTISACTAADTITAVTLTPTSIATPIALLDATVTLTNSDDTISAVQLVAAINNNPGNIYVTASNVAGVITLTGKPGIGVLMNTWVPGATGSGVTVGTVVNIGSGVAGVTALNGLRFGDSAAGVLVKDPSQTWSGVAGNTGTAGWFRFVGSVVDAGAADAAELYIRLDGNVATSGANLNLSSTTITSGATQTLLTFSLTEPAA